MGPRSRSLIHRIGTVGLALALLLVNGTSGVVPTLAQSSNSAEVVVRFEDGRVVSTHVTFSEASITGLEALRRTGLTLEESSGAVCRVDRTGCPSTDCFCQAKAEPYIYWSYYHWQAGKWQYANTGPDGFQVTNGAVEGWSWGEELPTSQPLAATQAGINWLRSKQLADGSYVNTGTTIDTLLAAGAAHQDGDAWRVPGGKSMIEYIESQAPKYPTAGAAALGKLALGIAAADLDPRSFIKHDLVISLTAKYNPATGAFGATNWDQAFAMLGWAAAGETIPVTATGALAQRHNVDGGWGYSTGLDSDIDSTGLMLQALVAGGTPVSATTVISGVHYLRAHQNADGGFPVDATTPTDPVSNVKGVSNANSTALAVQGLVAAGVNVFGITPAISSTTPISFLLSLQRPDGGFKWLTSDSASNLLATQQIIPALVGKAFPIHSRAVGLRKATNWVHTQQLRDGSFTGDTGSTIDAILGISAAGLDPQSFRSSTGKTPLDYLAIHGPTFAAKSTASAGKLALGVVAAGGDPRAIGGTNLVISITATYDRSKGAFGTTTYDQAYGILGLVASGQTVPVSATATLAALASPGGGWGFGANDAFPDADGTGLVLQALAAGGVPKTNQAVVDAFAFLRKIQNPDGGFPGFDGTTSPNSTGLALQGLAAYAEDGDSLEWSVTANGLTPRTPVDALLALQSAEGGFTSFGTPNNPSGTYQAIGGLAEVAVPTRSIQLVYLPMIVH